MDTTSKPWPWKGLLKAAILESDLSKLPLCIFEAQTVVTERMRSLDGVSEEEQCALLDAHNVLCDLCKMAGLQTTQFSRNKAQGR
jgi:hypothetical protein